MMRTGLIKKTTWLVLASVLCGLVLVVILSQIGPDSAPAGREGPEPDLEALAPSGLADRDSDNPILINPEGGGVQGRDAMKVTMEKGVLEYNDDEGRLAQRFTFDQQDVLPRGWHHFTNPIGEIYVSETRLLIIKADEAEALLVDDQPQAGRLIGRVHLALYEFEDVYAVESVEGEDPILVGEADEVQFDRNLNELRIDGRVEFRSAQWAMAGYGLTMIYSDQEQQVRNVRLRQREYILIRPDREWADQPVENESVTEVTSPDDGRLAKHVEGQSGQDDSVKHVAEPPVVSDEPVTEELKVEFYTVVLDDGVIVSQGLGEGEATIAGQRMSIDFSMSGDVLDLTLASGMRETRPEVQVDSSMHTSTDPGRADVSISPFYQIAYAGIAAIEPSFDQDSGFNQAITLLGSDSTRKEQDILITGDGPLFLRVLGTEKPDTLADANDVSVVVEGEPVRIDAPEGRASCRRVMYNEREQTIRLKRDTNHDLVIDLEGNRQLRSSESDLVVTLDNGAIQGASVDGAGQLIEFAAEPAPTDSASIVPVSNSTGSTPHSSSTARPRQDVLRLSWSRGMELLFDTVEIGINQNQDRLKAAVFQGDVRAEHSDGLMLNSGWLKASFEGMDESNRPILTMISAKENVHAASPEGEADADELNVVFLPDEFGEPVPDFADVAGHVRVADAENSMSANHMRVYFSKTLAEEADDQPSVDGGDGGSFTELSLGIDKITAMGQVAIELPNQQRAFAEHLEAYPSEERAVLTGSPVSLSDPSGQLLASEVSFYRVLNEEGLWSRIVSVPTDGTAIYAEAGGSVQGAAPGGVTEGRAFNWDETRRMMEKRLGAERDDQTESPEENPIETNEPDKADTESADEVGAAIEDEAPPSYVRIQWDESAEYTEGEFDTIALELKGRVLAEHSPSPNEYNKIEAENLTLTLTAPIERADGKAERHLNHMTATGVDAYPARIQAARYADDARTQPEMAFFITGPIIEYEDILQRLETFGDGSMFVLDRRPDDENTDGQPVSEKPNEALKDLSGRGDTLFKWTGQMTLDGGRGSMHCRDDVEVFHRSIERDQPMRLRCQSLDAELDSAVDIQALELSSREGMELRVARAERDVSVTTDERVIESQRLLYNGQDKLLILETDEEDDVVRIIEKDSAFPIEATRVIWDLFTDSIRVEGGRPVAVPSGG